MKQDINRYEILEKITPLIENTAVRFNLIPIEIEFIKENHKWFLRIYLYSYEKDITLDDCENVTRSLNDFLDELIPVKYYLEVSSPGLERKFKSDKEFLIFKGRRISLKLKTPLEGETEKIFKGEILDWDDNTGLKFLDLKTEKNCKSQKRIYSQQSYTLTRGKESTKYNFTYKKENK